ncbi:MAG: hypothetical protein SAK42_21895 [Oscillatoria sp. PMC 1076.18]|nr:hypothetical protein [Oscillatoria sp. PMC 1076.18]
MTTPNFKQMNRSELKKYIRNNPTDDQAIRELFVNRRNPKAIRYPYPYEMSFEKVETIFKDKINSVN